MMPCPRIKALIPTYVAEHANSTFFEPLVLDQCSRLVLSKWLNSFSDTPNQGMVGSGRATVAEICDISRANVADGHTSEAIVALRSMGACGHHESNQERDLHRWISGSFSMTLEPFEVPMVLNVSHLDYSSSTFF